MVTKVKLIADDIVSTDHLDPSASLTFTDLTLTGNLTVQGTTTTLDTTNLNVEDKNITLNYGTGDTSSNADGAGITIQDAVDASNDATLLWDAADDRFKFSHGLEVLTGSVGIGTSSPSAKLHIQPANSDTLENAIFTRQNNAAGSDGNTFVLRNDAANNFVEMNSGGTNNGGYKFYRGSFSGDPALTIIGSGATGGYVGIGTETPQTLFETATTGTTTNRLTVSSANEFTQIWVEDDDLQGILWKDGSDFTFGPAADVGGNGWGPYITIKDGGNVGIGTDSPTAAVSIRKSHATGYGSGIDMLDFKAYFPPNYDTETSKASIFVGTSDKHTLNTHGGYLAFRVNQSGFSGTSGSTNLAEAMRIEKDGRLGIGTTSPNHPLHLHGGSAQTNLAVSTNDGYISEVRMMEDAAGTQHGGFIRYDGNGDYVRIGHYNTGTELIGFTMKDDGNVGIGVSNPGYKLAVSSKLTVGDAPAVGLSGNTIHVRENSSSGIHFPLVIGGGTHVAGAAFGLAFDPEGYGNRNKIAILAEGIGAGYSRGRLHFALDNANDSGQVTLADSKMCITESGNIGIGAQVDNPSGTLDIRGGRAGIISTSSSWGQFRVANSSVAEVGITVANGCTATEYLSDDSPSSSNKFIMGISPYGSGNDTWGIGHGNLGDSVMHIDGSGNFGFGVNTDNPVSFAEFLKVRPNVNAPSDYELKMTLNTYGYVGSNYKLALLQWLGGDTAGAQDNFYAGIGSTALDGVNNSEEGSLDFHVRNGVSTTETLAVQIIGKAGTGIAGSGQHAKSVLFRYQGLAIDRVWGGYPGISVLNSSDAGTTQSEFRFHGTNSSSAAYPGTSGSDFSVVVRSDGGYATGSDRRRKRNITTIDNALSKVKQLTGKRFQTVNRVDEVQEHVSKNGYKLGFIAQDVEDIIPEAVQYHADEDDGTEDWNSAYSMDYGSVVALLVNAIKEQDTTIQDLKSRIETLEG